MAMTYIVKIFEGPKTYKSEGPTKSLAQKILSLRPMDRGKDKGRDHQQS